MQRLGKYEIVEPLGRGGMGVVYRAVDRQLGRTVALKMMPPEMRNLPTRRERFLREAQAAAALHHPNIATLFEFGVMEHSDDEKGIPYIAMEYVDGRDLDSLIEQGVSSQVALDVALQLTRGLAAAHESGIVHRDLKPRNIRVTSAGEVKILDFGLARFDTPVPSEGETFETQQGAVMGTAPYMAPEQARGEEADARADLFALGVILYQMLSGQLPFKGRNLLDYVRKVESSDAPPIESVVPDLDPRIGRLVGRLLASDPGDRFTSATAVAMALADLRDSAPMDWIPESDEDASRVVPAWIPWSVLAATALVVAAVAVVVLRQSPAEAQPLRLAVLPFDNQSGESSLDYLAGGLGGVVGGELTSLPGLAVVSHRISSGYTSNDGLGQLVRDFAIDRVIEGQVLRGSDGVTVEVSVIDPISGDTLWFDRFDADVDELPRLQRTIARAVCDFFDTLEPEQAERLAVPVSGSADAIRHHLLGLGYLRSGLQSDTQEELEVAEYLLLRALDEDPELAAAWLDLSRTYAGLAEIREDPTMLEKAIAAAETAQRLDPGMVEATLQLGRLFNRAGQPRRAEETLAPLSQAQRMAAGLQLGERRAVDTVRQLVESQIDQNDLEAAEATLRAALVERTDEWSLWNLLGEISIRRERYEEAEEALERARTLAPLEAAPFDNLQLVRFVSGDTGSAIEEFEAWRGPRDAVLLGNIGTVYYFDGQLEKAEGAFEQAVRLAPFDELLRGNLGDLYRKQGREEQARAQYEAALAVEEQKIEVFPESYGPRIGRAFWWAKLGQCDAALAALESFEESMPATLELTSRAAKSHAVCGDEDAALEALERARAAGVPASLVACDDEFESLRENPDFVSLVGEETIRACSG